MRQWNYDEAKVNARFPHAFKRTQHGKGNFSLYSNKKSSKRVIVYFPGGAYSLGPLGVHYEMLKKLCDKTKAFGVLLDYPKTPEFSHHDIREFITSLLPKLREKFPTEGFDFVGDSAGGALAVATACAHSDLISPRTVIALSPWFDLELSDPRTEEYALRDPYLAPPGIRGFGKWYAKGTNPRDPFLSPLYGAEKSPALLIEIYSGTNDVIHPGVLDFVEKRRASGAPVSFHEYPGMLHAFALMPIPEAKRALKQIVSTLLR
jgi:epsilon-lactone hydrolase